MANNPLRPCQCEPGYCQYGFGGVLRCASSLVRIALGNLSDEGRAQLFREMNTLACQHCGEKMEPPGTICYCTDDS